MVEGAGRLEAVIGAFSYLDGCTAPLRFPSGGRAGSGGGPRYCFGEELLPQDSSGGA